MSNNFFGETKDNFRFANMCSNRMDSLFHSRFGTGYACSASVMKRTGRGEATVL